MSPTPPAPRFSRADSLLLLHILVQSVILLVVGAGEWTALIAGAVSVTLLLLLTAWTHAPPGLRLAHDFAPVPLVVVGYLTSAALTRALDRAPCDVWLGAADAWLFSALAHGWRYALGRPAWLTEVALVSYASFYVAPIVVAVVLHRRNRRAFDDYLTCLVLAFVMTWIGYALLPAAGPRNPVMLGDSLSGNVFHRFLRLVERNHFDAFPSGHTAVAVLMAWFGARLRGGSATVVLAAGIVFSTVYLSYHYVIDVVVGAVVAGSTLAATGLAGWLQRRARA